MTFITKLEGHKFVVNVDLGLYSKEAINQTLYKFSGDYYVFQRPSKSESNCVELIFESKEEKPIDESIVKTICNDLIDQQVRCDTEAKFGHIRDLIVEEAFKPVNR